MATAVVRAVCLGMSNEVPTPPYRRRAMNRKWDDLRWLAKYMLSRWRGYDPKRRRSNLSGPLVVQVQTVDRCNGSCIMCPARDSGKSGPPNYMEERLFSRIAEEVRRAGTVLTFTPMLQNEPLLDPDLGKRVGQAREILDATSRVVIVTNGSTLTRDRIDELVNANVDELEVSVDAHSEETYRAIRHGLDFSTVIQNVHSLIRHRGKTRVAVRFLRQRANESEEKEFVRYWWSQGAEVRVMDMTNRAGALKAFHGLWPPKGETLRGRVMRIMQRFWPCLTGPFTSLNVPWNGQVVLCCHDWGPTEIIGDLSVQSVSDVWNGDAFNHHRHLLWSRRFEESRVCRDCSLVRDS